MRVIHLDDPSVEFGTGEAASTEEGLATFGPYSLRLGAAYPAAVRVGIVGTPESVSLTQDFLTRCKSPIEATRDRCSPREVPQDVRSGSVAAPCPS